VTDLLIAVDWAAASAALAPLPESNVASRSPGRYRPLPAHPVNFPLGEISFEACGFERRLSGNELLVDHQCLSPSERDGA
jgi:hypothetical protein